MKLMSKVLPYQVCLIPFLASRVQMLCKNNLQLMEFNSILHQQHRKLSGSSGSSICKERRSSVQHSHKVFYFLRSILSTNHPTSLCHSEHFTGPPNPYSSPCLNPRTHDPDLQPPLQHFLLSPHHLL